MAAIDRSTQRVIAVITLMIVAAWALRGYIPGGERVAERERPPSNPAALIVVIAMLCAAVAIIGFAIIARMRDRRAQTPLGGRPATQPGRGGAAELAFLPDAARHGDRLPVARAAVDATRRADRTTRVRSTGCPGDQCSGRPTPHRARRPRTSEPESDTNVVGYLVPPMLVLMVLVIVGTAIASRRQRGAPSRSTPSTTTPTRCIRPRQPGFPSPGRQKSDWPRSATCTREPREAIIACYAAMERELTRVPGAVPQDCDTPSEVLARAVDNRALRADSATELVELFEEARFSPHVMTEGHRDAAVRVLERVLAELPDVTARSVA